MVSVTDSELWLAVGAFLAGLRSRRGFPTVNAYLREHRGPAKATIEAIEGGNPGNVTSIGEYADNLGHTLARVFTAVLKHAPEAKLQPDIQDVVDALQLKDPPNADVLEPWKDVVKLAATGFLRAARQRHESTTEQNAGTAKKGGGTAGKRPVRQK